MGQAGQRRSTADGGVTVPIRQVPSLAMLIPEQLGPAQSRPLAVVAAGAGNNTIAIASGAMTQRGPQRGPQAAAEVPNQAQGTAQLAAAMHKEAANVADATPVSAPGSCQPQLALGEQPRSGLFMAPVCSNQLQPAGLQQAGPSSSTPTLPAACKAHMSQALVAKQVEGMQHSLSVASSKGQWGACGLLLSLLGRLKVTPEVLCSTQAAVAVAALKKCTNAATRQEAR